MPSPTFPRNERPDRDYVDSDPTAALDDESVVVPIPDGQVWVGSWQYALPLFIRTGGDFSAQTRLRYDWCVRIFFRHPRMQCMRLNQITVDLLHTYRQFLFERTQPGLRMHETPAAQQQQQQAPEQVSALAVWAPPRRGRPSSRGPGALSTATMNVRLVALRSFLQFCRKRGWLTPELDHDTINDVLKGVKAVSTVPQDILFEYEWAGFAEAARAPSRGDGSRIKTKEGNTGDWTWKRDYAIVMTFLGTAVRCSELVNLNIGNFSRVRLDDGTEEWRMSLANEQTKGGYGGGTIPVALDVIAAIADYLAEEGRTWRDRASPLFLSWHPSSSGGSRRLNPHTVNCIIYRVREQWLADRRAAGDDVEARNIHPHSTRASAAVALMRGNAAKGRPKAGLHDTQRFLRHSNPNTTDRYLRGLDVGEQLRPFALSIEAPKEAPKPEREPEQRADATDEEVDNRT
ncbi:MAG: tyrosine-type recombinase/integrase [Ktedonobacterales bacterium]